MTCESYIDICIIVVVRETYIDICIILVVCESYIDICIILVVRESYIDKYKEKVAVKRAAKKERIKAMFDAAYDHEKSGTSDSLYFDDLKAEMDQQAKVC